MIVVDEHISINWSVRYNDQGDVELILPSAPKYVSAFDIDVYLSITDSDRIMIIDQIYVNNQGSDGVQLTVTGSTLDTILNRRIIRNHPIVSGSFEQEIFAIIRENCIECEEKRKIPGLTLVPSNDENILSTTLEETDLTNENLYDAVRSLCQQYDIGYRMDSTEDGGFAFSLYKGADRSWEQNLNSPVVFSPTYDNLISSNYVKNGRFFKNACYVNYQIEVEKVKFDPETSQVSTYTETVDKITEVEYNGASGLERREMVTSADNGNYDEEEKPEESVVESRAKQTGFIALLDSSTKEAMDGEMDSNGQFKYGVDFFLGDIVQVEDGLGMQGRCRVKEIVISEDSSGHTLVPTFEFIKEED